MFTYLLCDRLLKYSILINEEINESSKHFFKKKDKRRTQVKKKSLLIIISSQFIPTLIYIY